MREALREEKRVVADVVKLWSETRNALARQMGHGYLRYIDKPSLARLRLAAKRALDAGYDHRDIIAGIRAHVTDVEASPAYVDRWAGEACGTREDREELERQMRIRMNADANSHNRDSNSHRAPGLRRLL